MGSWFGEAKEKISHQEDDFHNLIRWNRIMCVLHLIQALIMLYLGTKLVFQIEIMGMWYDYTQIDSGFPPFLHPTSLFVINNMGMCVSLFLFMSSLAHFVAGVLRKDQYVQNLENKSNPYRWWEYSFSASTMIVIIALFFTIVDLATLILMFGCIFIMNLCGLIMERMNSDRDGDEIDWSPYILGCFAWILPWIIIILHFWGAIQYGGIPPDFVYGIFFVEFALFSCFALVMVAYYKGWGKFKEYLFCEKSYQILSLVAKSMLAWLVFGGIFSPN